ncbi:hypothetical protein PQQ99_13160 [Paraburkholderia sediminicola]|uniref:hypothetical protein n=1 Tax=Paraburkholderia sediminicola TaxID=458836 RepID=UPI0038B8AC56
MINAISVGSPSAFIPQFFNSSVLLDEDVFEGGAWYNALAEQLLDKMKQVCLRPVFQRNTVGTYTQIEATVPTELDLEFFSATATVVSQLSSTSTAWVAGFLRLLAEGREDAALKEISLVTTRLKASDDFAQLRDGLKKIEFAQLPDIVLVGLLRNIFSVRLQIDDWDSLVSQAEQLLDKRNRNSRALLRGLKNFSKIGTP